MLILTRRVSESVIIMDDIIISVLEINRGQVRLGIEAPRDVVIDREEIALKKNRGSKIWNR